MSANKHSDSRPTSQVTRSTYVAPTLTHYGSVQALTSAASVLKVGDAMEHSNSAARRP